MLISNLWHLADAFWLKLYVNFSRSLNDASCQTRNISYSESATQSSYTAEIDVGEYTSQSET